MEESENRLHRSAGDFQIMTAGLLIAAHVFPLLGRFIAEWRSIIELGSRCRKRPPTPPSSFTLTPVFFLFFFSFSFPFPLLAFFLFGISHFAHGVFFEGGLLFRILFLKPSPYTLPRMSLTTFRAESSQVRSQTGRTRGQEKKRIFEYSNIQISRMNRANRVDQVEKKR